MSYPVKIEVFHKILHEAAHYKKPIHENEAYSNFSEEDKKEFEQIKLIWEKSAQYQPKEEFNTSAAFHTFLNKIQSDQVASEKLPKETPKIFRLPLFLIRYAAIFVALAAATYFFINRPVHYKTGDTGLMVTLDDQSKIWLNEQSSLTVKKYSSNKREVTLQGEAYFDIYKNNNAPFAIQTGDIEVVVLGTTFVLDSKNKILEVLSGTVQMNTRAQEVIVKENEKVTIDSDIMVKSQGSGQLPDWANPLLIFNNVPFDKVVKDLEAYFGVSITLVGDKDWSQCPFTSGSLVNTRFDDILTLLKLTYELEVVQKGEKGYTFSKVRCK